MTCPQGQAISLGRRPREDPIDVSFVPYDRHPAVAALIRFGVSELVMLGHLTVNDKIAAGLERPAEIIIVAVRSISSIVVVGMFAIGGYYYFTESSWYPRTREMVVFTNDDWVAGEPRMCFSSETNDNGELAALTCDPFTLDRHMFSVTFWGPITADGLKMWKCKRGQTSLTCRLQ